MVMIDIAEYLSLVCWLTEAADEILTALASMEWKSVRATLGRWFQERPQDPASPVQFHPKCAHACQGPAE